MADVQKQIDDKSYLRQNAFVSSLLNQLPAPAAIKQSEQLRAAEDTVVWPCSDLTQAPHPTRKESAQNFLGPVLPRCKPYLSNRSPGHVIGEPQFRPDKDVLCVEQPLTPTKGRQLAGVPSAHPHVQGVDQLPADPSWGYLGGQASCSSYNC